MTKLHFCVVISKQNHQQKKRKNRLLSTNWCQMSLKSDHRLGPQWSLQTHTDKWTTATPHFFGLEGDGAKNAFYGIDKQQLFIVGCLFIYNNKNAKNMQYRGERSSPTCILATSNKQNATKHTQLQHTVLNINHSSTGQYVTFNRLQPWDNCKHPQLNWSKTSYITKVQRSSIVVSSFEWFMRRA